MAANAANRANAANAYVQRARSKGRARKWCFLVLLFVYIGFVSVSFVLKLDYLRGNGGRQGQGGDALSTLLASDEGHSRVRREAGLEDEIGAEEDDRNCTPRAIKEFPDNFFTHDETRDGGMAAHIVIALYMFGALAIVCDDYFVASLEVICDRLNLQEDVAGATFMAAGSSAPEFFTSVIGVFIAKSDVGVGTIVGSAVFNILFIIGVCAIFAGMVVKLTWYPMTRDCVSYLVSIAVLVLIIDDEEVYWYEAMCLVILYIVYIVLMYFNRTLEERAINTVANLIRRFKGGDTDVKEIATDEKQPLSGSYRNSSPSTVYTNSIEKVDGLGAEAGSTKETTLTENSSETNDIEDSIESPWTLPDSWLMRVYYFVMLPLKALMYFTIPDCRRRGVFRRLYLATFVMSIVWIAACSYIMVWMVTIVGDALDIPDTVMGLTILAAGTSVPDCLSSVFVARDGYGDMAVSNSIGSNVFDILMCLGLPWLLDTTIIKKGDPLLIHSRGIGYSALILLSTVAFMLVAIHLARWKLNKPFGILCLIAYAAVITVSCLFELNIFGDFVLPSCPRDEDS